MAPGQLPLTLRAAADGPHIEIRTQELQRDLAELLRWAEEFGVHLAGLDARSASLEEAFLDIAAQRAGAGTPGVGTGDNKGTGVAA